MYEDVCRSVLGSYKMQINRKTVDGQAKVSYWWFEHSVFQGVAAITTQKKSNFYARPIVSVDQYSRVTDSFPSKLSVVAVEFRNDNSTRPSISSH